MIYSHYMAAISSPCFSSLLLARATRFSFARLGEMKLKQGLRVGPQRPQKLVAFLALPFLPRGTLSNWDVPSWY